MVYWKESALPGWAILIEFLSLNFVNDTRSLRLALYPEDIWMVERLVNVW
jgi:hypothetical protein